MKNMHWLITGLSMVLLATGAPLVGWTGISEPWLAPDQGMAGRSDLYRAGQQALARLRKASVTKSMKARAASPCREPR